jgi:hypothetical protein
VLVKELAYTGAAVPLDVRVRNLDSVQQCFYYGDRVTVPDGWGYFWTIPPGDDGSEQLFGVCIPPGATIERQVNIIPSGEYDGGPSLVRADVAVAFVERERGAIGDSDGATITRYREPVTVKILSAMGDGALRPNGVDTTRLTVGVFDFLGTPVEDGTLVEIVTDLGTVEPAPVAAASPAASTPASPAAGSYTAETRDGNVFVTFVAGTQAGNATVTATVNGKTASAVVPIRGASVHAIELAASPTDLSGGAATAQLVATVRDNWGAPVPGVSVRIGVSDDSGTQGSLGGQKMVAGVSDANGRVAVTFTKAAGAVGKVVARAEYLAQKDGTVQVIDEASVTLTLSGVNRRVYLPAVRK